MRRAVLVTGFVACFLALPAAGQEPQVQETPLVQQAQSPAHDPLDCMCRAQGRLVPLGATICLRTAEGPRMAECRMVTNVTSWGITEQPCPES
jgi:hypothetical protein